LYVVSEDGDGSLAKTNDIVKKNIKTWITGNKMINDTIDIMDAKVINLSIDFVAVGSLDASKYDVLEQGKQKLIEYFSRAPDIGEPFFITDVYKQLKKVEGIVDVTDVKITQKYGSSGGRTYSNIRFDLDQQTSADGRYIEMPLNVIYEIRFPFNDISGVII